MQKLLLYLNNIYPISSALANYLQTILKIKELPRKAYFLKQGYINIDFAFVEKGLLRCYYDRDEKEVSSWFIKEHDVIISTRPFTKQPSTYVNIQALEDSVLYYMGNNELQYIFNHFPESNFIGRVLMERYYSLSEERLYSIRMQKAEERYRYLVLHSPDLIKRVPSKYIASYLSITEETLSRIRSRR